MTIIWVSYLIGIPSLGLSKPLIKKMPDHKPYLAAFLTFGALALFDALIGGAISTLLRLGGWTALDQRLNDVYHVNYAVIVTAALLWHYAHFKHRPAVLAIAILFLGYVEDTLFYLLTPLFNPAIKLLTKGELFQMAGGETLPQQISGWLGWVGRAWWGRNIALERPILFAVNAIAILSVILLFCLKHQSTHKTSARDGFLRKTLFID